MTALSEGERLSYTLKNMEVGRAGFYEDEEEPDDLVERTWLWAYRNPERAKQSRRKENKTEQKKESRS